MPSRYIHLEGNDDQGMGEDEEPYSSRLIIAHRKILADILEEDNDGAF